MKYVEMYVVSYFFFFFLFYLNGFFISCDTIDLFVQTPIDDFLLSFRSPSFSFFWIYLISKFSVSCALVWLLNC